jgi:RNA polymerase-binding transcription factor DksA
MDVLDRAAVEEERERQNAIKNHSIKKIKTQCFNDGVVVCCKCNEQISLMRLSVIKNANLCIICQAQSEILK